MLRAAKKQNMVEPYKYFGRGERLALNERLV
jgi:hypothetical protein